MEIIKRDIGTLRYPVGERFIENFGTLNDMCGFLREVLDEKYPGVTNVHFLCRGSSGAIIAAIVGQYIYMNTERKVHIDHFKKEGENSHNHNMFDEKLLFTDSVVVVIDDIICTGLTINAILKDLARCTNSHYPHILCISGDIKEELLEDWKFEYVLCDGIAKKETE